MGKRGPKRTPTATKIARGTHRKDRDGDPKLEPQPEKISAPPPPGHLGRVGRSKWKDLAPRLSKIGLLTEQDLDALTLLCEAFEEKARCEAQLEKEGEYYWTESGYCGVHPAVSRLQRTIDRIRKLMAAFGMTPADRAGMKIQAPGQAAKKVQTRKRK
jgi:P27 family predicted phage terminase small subunit